MRVHLFHQYFRHPDEGGALRTYFISKALLSAGHEVLVITAHNEQRGLQEIEGISVHYLPIPYSNQFPFRRRVTAFLRFIVLSIWVSRKYPRPDLNYIITTPLTTGLIGLWLRRWKGIPYVFEVGDLWPEVPIQMGVISNKLLQKVLYRLERRIYVRAEKLVGLSPPIRDYMEYHCDFQVQAVSIPNMSDNTFFQPTTPPKELSAQQPLVVCYMGTFGLANHLEYILRLAKECHRQQLPITFELMGEGAQGKFVRDQAADIPNVQLHAFGNRQAVKQLIDRSHAVYVSFVDVPILNTGSPNKFFDGLAAGKLILLNFGGWMKKLVEENECGVYCPPNAPEEAIDGLRPFLSSPMLLAEYQINARGLAEEQFDREALCRQLIDYLSIR